MTFDELAQLPYAPDPTCHDCGCKLTPENYSGVDQILDGTMLQGICQSCYRLDDVVHLDKLLGGEAAPQGQEESK